MAYEPQPEPAAPVLQTAMFEPLPTASYAAQRSSVDTEIRREPLAPEPIAAAPEPTVIQPQVRPIARIVDPSVADDEDEPLFSETPRFAQERHQKSSWLSIFGRPRHDEAPRPQLRTTTASQAQPEEAAEREEDLEIPSFLRRLAN